MVVTSSIQCSHCGRSGWSFNRNLIKPWLDRVRAGTAPSLCELCYRKFYGRPRPEKKARCAVCAKSRKLTEGVCKKCTDLGYSAPTLFDQGA